VDIVEIGTPLIIEEGHALIRHLHILLDVIVLRLMEQKGVGSAAMFEHHANLN
jgi:3-keto-L-gulonate-6-phosphate decarboxylase